MQFNGYWLIVVILQHTDDTPYGTSIHVYTDYADDATFDDDDLYPIMIYMGFSNKDSTLLYTPLMT